MLETSISILTVCVTLLLGVGGFLVNSFIQRKSNSIAVITQTRLSRREQTRVLFSELLALSDPAYLALATDERLEIVKKSATLCGELRSYYSRSFPLDGKLIDAGLDLHVALSEYLSAPCKNALTAVKEKREEFSKIADVYMQTEWKRIKFETVGKGKKGPKSLPSWEHDYHSYEEYYNKHNAK